MENRPQHDAPPVPATQSIGSTRIRLIIERFPFLQYPVVAELAPSSAAGVARDGRDETTAPTEAIRFTIDASQEAKMEILGQLFLLMGETAIISVV